MLAISNIVPGPVGTNLSSLVGFKVFGVTGALIAICGILIPSLIFVIIISKILKEFENNKFVKSIFYMLKPTSRAMIAAIGFKLLKTTIFKSAHIGISTDWIGLILFLSLIAISFKYKKSPIFYLGISAFVGIAIEAIKLYSS